MQLLRLIAGVAPRQSTAGDHKVFSFLPLLYGLESEEVDTPRLIGLLIVAGNTANSTYKIWRLLLLSPNLRLVQRQTSEPCDLQRRFGLSVRQLRLDRGLTQEQLAELAQLQPSYVSSVERGVRNITICNIERIAKALGLSIAELMRDL